VAARARMTLRLLATPVGDDEFELTISAATFGSRDAADTARLRSKRLRPPKYPPTAAHWGASATAYVLLKVGADGRVAESFVEQVNLHGKTDPKTMALLRTRFAEESLDAARHWTFIPPTTGDEAGYDHWMVRVPIAYNMSDRKPAGYGQWETYVAGPRHGAPWLKTPIEGNDAIARGSLQLAGRGLRLLTPLQPQG